MSNQIVISSGAKVRSLEGVLTGTAGIVNSVPLGGANGVATLDSGGKVPVSQLPSSVVTYLGTWDASTNTPTLTNGTGDAGDMYICNVAGTVNFGAGPITFAVGDWVLYGSGTWQKSNGQNGTVTSVGISTSANALTITNSPITTSGNIGVNFNGNSGQYVSGDGNLVTFPSIITQAQNLVTEVYNETGATLTKGTVVYINGGHGNLPTVTKALATSDATSAQTYGVVRADITNNNNGYVTVIGNLDNMDTQAYAAGTQLYLSSTTAGAYTSVKQYAPAHLVYVGIVTRSHPTQGVIEVKIQNGFELDELHNVSAQTPSNNDGLFYNSSNSLWENKSIATALGYTPANDALVVKLAGTQTIAGQKTFNATLFGTDAEFSGSILSPIVAILDNTTYTKVVRLQTTAATNRDVYFPDLNGTVALLEGTQTFSGAKTFSVSVNNDDGLKIKLGSASNLTAGYLTLSAYGETTPLPDRTILRIGTAATQMSLFKLQNTGSYTYDFPATSGTLALTSNLSSYVPYTGATTAVNLGSNALTALTLYSNAGIALSISGQFTGGGGYTGINGQALGIDIRPNSGGIFNLNFSSTTNRTFTFPDTSGTLVLGTGTTNYLPKFTGTSTIGDSPFYDASGSIGLNTITPALNGFNREFTVNAGISGTARAAINIQGSRTSSSTFGVLGFFHQTNYVAGIESSRGGDATSGILQFFTSNTTGATEKMRLDASGNLGLGTSSPSYKFQAYSSGDVVIAVTDASNAGVSALNLGNTTNLADGGIRYDNSTDALIFRGNNSERMRLDASGNLGLGVANPTSYITRFIEVSNATSSGIKLSGSSSGLNAGVSLGFITSDNSFRITNYETTGVIRLETQDLTRATVTAAGNFLIGTTTDAGYKLDVNGTGRFASALTVTNGNIQFGTSENVLKWTSGNGVIEWGSAGTLYLRPTGAASNSLTIASTGAATFTFDNNSSGVVYSRNVSGTIYELGSVKNSGSDILYQGTGSVFINADSNSDSTAADREVRLGNRGVAYMTLASTGAATFSSSVTAASSITSTSGDVYATDGTRTNYLGVSTGSNIGILGMTSNHDLRIITNNTQRLLISSTGAATFSSTIWAQGAGSVTNPTFAVRNDDCGLYSPAINTLGFTVNSSERMRITSGGNVVIGDTSAINGAALGLKGTVATQQPLSIWNSGTGASIWFIEFETGSTITARGSITYNGTNVLYNATSDYRLKQDLKDFDGLDKVSKIKVYDFLWKDTEIRDKGVIAHELAEVMPLAVTGEKDGEKMQGVDYSKIVPVLVKAIQELSAKVTELENKLK